MTNIFPNPVAGGDGGPNGGSGPLDFDHVYVWNGSGYTTYTLDSDYTCGVGDANDHDTLEANPPTINPGTLFYIDNNGGNISTPSTNSLAGVVHVDGAATGSQAIGSTTNVLVTGLNFVASKLPLSGGLSSVLQLTNPIAGGGGNGGPNGGNGQLDFSKVYIPNIVNGTIRWIYGLYNKIRTITLDGETSMTIIGAGNGVPEPPVPVRTGIIIPLYANAKWR